MAKTTILDIDISSLLQSFATLERFYQEAKSDLEKAGAIQAFEYSYELAWKTMKRLLAQKGVEVFSPKQTFRAAASEKLINDVETWFAFVEVRNMTVHTYNLKTADNVFSKIPHFIKALKTFITTIQTL